MSETTPETLAFLSQEFQKLTSSELAIVFGARLAPICVRTLVGALSSEDQGVFLEGLLMAFESEAWEDLSLAERITDRGYVLSHWVDEEVNPDYLLQRAGDEALASAIGDKAATVSEWLANGEVSVFID